VTTNKQKLEALRELQKRQKLSQYQTNFELFAKEQIKILPKDSSQGFKYFEFNEAQHIVNNRIEEQLAETGRVRAIILKARQMGLSTYTTARVFWKSYFNAYNKSVVMAETMNFINGGKDSVKMLNMSPVFDNFIVDSQSYLQVMYVANNIIVPKVMEWDMPVGFVEDFRKQLGEAVNQLKKEGSVVTINNKSPYKGLLTVLDREYSYIKNVPDKDLSKNQLALKRVLMDRNSGYISPEERPETILLKNTQFMELANAIIAMYNLGGATGKLAKWTTLAKGNKDSAMSRVKEHAKRGEIYFFT